MLRRRSWAWGTGAAVAAGAVLCAFLVRRGSGEEQEAGRDDPTFTRTSSRARTMPGVGSSVTEPHSHVERSEPAGRPRSTRRARRCNFGAMRTTCTLLLLVGCGAGAPSPTRTSEVSPSVTSTELDAPVQETASPPVVRVTWRGEGVWADASALLARLGGAGHPDVDASLFERRRVSFAASSPAQRGHELQEYLISIARAMRSTTGAPVEGPRIALDAPPDAKVACIRDVVGSAWMVYSDLVLLTDGSAELVVPLDASRCTGPWCSVPAIVVEPEGASVHVRFSRARGAFDCSFDSRLIRGRPAPDGLFVERRPDRDPPDDLPAWAGAPTSLSRVTEPRLLSELPAAMPAPECGYAVMVPSHASTVSELLELAERLAGTGYPVQAIDWSGMDPETRRPLSGSTDATCSQIDGPPDARN